MPYCIDDVLDLYTKGVVKRHAGDSGLDVYIPREHIIMNQTRSYPIALGIKCKMTEVAPDVPRVQSAPAPRRGYLLVPRSSIAKTPLRMSNSIGVVDAGYDGELMAYVDNISLTEKYKVGHGDRLFQIICGDQVPFTYCITNDPDFRPTIDLISIRGEAGLGSSGR